MISKLAEDIYAKAIQLKKYNSRNLFFSKNRSDLQNELQQIQESVNIIHYQLQSDATYSAQYYELATLMQNELIEYQSLLITKPKNYRTILSRRVWGFHNLTRAFLPPNNLAGLTAGEAITYYSSYLNSNSHTQKG